VREVKEKVERPIRSLGNAGSVWVCQDWLSKRRPTDMRADPGVSFARIVHSIVERSVG